MPWGKLIQVVKRRRCRLKTIKFLIVYYNDISSSYSLVFNYIIVNIGKALLETEASDIIMVTNIITSFLSPLLQKSDIIILIDTLSRLHAAIYQGCIGTLVVNFCQH